MNTLMYTSHVYAHINGLHSRTNLGQWPVAALRAGRSQVLLYARPSHPFDKIDCNNSRRNGTRNTILHEFLAALNTHLLRNLIMFLLGKSFQDPILFSNIFALLSSTPPQRKCEPSLES